MTLHSQKLQAMVMGDVIRTDNDDAEAIPVALMTKRVTMVAMTYYCHYFEHCFLTARFASVGVVVGIFGDIAALNVREVQMIQEYYHPIHHL